MSKCNHEPDINNIQHADTDVVESPDGSEFSFIMDIWCKKCGQSGSFIVSVKKEDIDW